jgi:5-methylcytosine-specific restriction endonuclease McrA
MSKKLCAIHGVHGFRKCPKCLTIQNKSYDKHSRNKSAKKIYDSTAWRKHTRPAVLVRDAFTCAMCSKLFKSSELIVDHIIEIKDGGDKFNKSNLQTLCIGCHNIKTSDERKKRGGWVKSLQPSPRTTEPPTICLDKPFSGGTLG